MAGASIRKSDDWRHPEHIRKVPQQKFSGDGLRRSWRGRRGGSQSRDPSTMVTGLQMGAPGRVYKESGVIMESWGMSAFSGHEGERQRRRQIRNQGVRKLRTHMPEKTTDETCGGTGQPSKASHRE